VGNLSLRTRLLIAVGAITLFALVAADVTIYASLNSYLYRQVDSTLQLSHMTVEAAADGDHDDAPTPNQVPPGTSEFCAVGRESAPGMFIEVRSVDNKTEKGRVCPAYEPGQKSYSPALPPVISGFTKTSADPHEPVTYFTVGSTKTAGPEFRVRASKLTDGGTLIVAEPLDTVTSTLDRLLLLEIAVTAAALVVAVALGLWLVRVGLRPLRDVVKTADSISGGDEMDRVPGANDRTEVGHVATALNVMLERIESSFATLQQSEHRMRRFASDASHELRTPISAISAYTQLFHRGASEHAEDLPRVMSGIEREAGRMSRLVEDLLLLARFDEHHLIEVDPVELVGLVAEAIETAQMVGPGWPITLSAEGPVEVLGDSSALRQVVDNLFANVRAHTPPGTPTVVHVGISGEEAVVEVADAGPGIDEELIESMFERFVRADPSRSRATGGAGLGLAIASAIMRAHGGSIDARKGSGGGVTFEIRLPALATQLGDERDDEDV
jgi:two-component system OmpR family sensor kinase